MKIYNKKNLNLLRELVLSQFKLKDQSTFFGFIWSFLNPLVMLIVLLIFFRFRLGEDVKHYAIYLLIGIIQYTHFSNSTSASMRVLYSMKQLTCNTVFPKELLVIGTILSNAIEFILSMFICITIAYFAGVDLSWTVIMLPFVFVLQLMLVSWVSLILSCLHVFVRDIEHIYQVLLRLLFFITPIFYDLSFLGKGTAKYIVLLNPLTHLIDFSRTVVIEGKLFSIESFLLLLFANAFLIYSSFKIFRQFEPTFAEHV
ncbi:MAG: ABC transporter permease [Thermodesulfobacteriota bacterium]